MTACDSLKIGGGGGVWIFGVNENEIKKSYEFEVSGRAQFLPLLMLVSMPFCDDIYV